MQSDVSVEQLKETNEGVYFIFKLLNVNFIDKTSGLELYPNILGYQLKYLS